MILGRQLGLLAVVVLLLIGATVLGILTNTLQQFYFERFDQEILLVIQHDLLDRALRFPKSFFDDKETGYLMTCLVGHFMLVLQSRFSLLIALSAFIYALRFSNVVDAGSVSFQMMSVFLVFYLARRWIASLEEGVKLSWAYPLTIGIIIFLGIYAKLAYFFFLPAVICLVFYHVVDNR